MNAKIKKVGNIKFFQAPYSSKIIKKMKKSGIDPNKDALEDGGAQRTEIKQKKKKEKLKKKENTNDKLIEEFEKKKNLEEDEQVGSSDSESASPPSESTARTTATSCLSLSISSLSS
jgi:hypothetical protein